MLILCVFTVCFWTINQEMEDPNKIKPHQIQLVEFLSDWLLNFFWSGLELFSLKHLKISQGRNHKPLVMAYTVPVFFWETVHGMFSNHKNARLSRFIALQLLRCIRITDTLLLPIAKNIVWAWKKILYQKTESEKCFCNCGSVCKDYIILQQSLPPGHQWHFIFFLQCQCTKTTNPVFTLYFTFHINKSSLSTEWSQ